jgi:hypothetical protein
LGFGFLGGLLFHEALGDPGDDGADGPDGGANDVKEGDDDGLEHGDERR